MMKINRSMLAGVASSGPVRSALAPQVTGTPRLAGATTVDGKQLRPILNSDLLT